MTSPRPDRLMPGWMALLFALAMLPPTLARAGAGAGTPNVVIILADDLGWGSVGCYGANPELVRTPNVDRLAREGRRFTDANAPSSVCSPTRYGLLTGRYCWRTSLHREVLAYNAPLHIEPTRLNLASLFHKHGYQTAAIGKWHLGYGAAPGPTDFTRMLRPGPLDLGFNHHFGVPSNHGDKTGVFVEDEHVLGLRSATLRPGETRNFKGTPYLSLDAPQRVDEDVMPTLNDRAVSWLERQDAAHPFFLYYAPVAVHEPVTPSSATRGTSRGGKYCDWIHDLDLSVGRVLDVLDRKDLARDTLVLLTSDNGGVVALRQDRSETDAYRAGLRPNGEFRDGKVSIYEGGFRVPFLVRWPGHVPAGTVCDAMTSLVDVLASLAAVVGEPLPPPSVGAEDSVNMLPAWLGADQAGPTRTEMIDHSCYGNFAIRQGPWKYIEGKPSGGKINLVPAAWRPEFQAQLFNLTDDPREQDDQIQRRPEVAQRLQALLDQQRDVGHTRTEPGKAPTSPGPGPRCDRVRFFPAPGGEAAMVGGRFRGSNVSRTEGFALLAEITSAPPAGAWSELRFDNPKVYRWLRYDGPPGSHGKVAEVEFYAGDRKLSGPGSGYGPIVKDAGRSWQKAFDGNPRTWVEWDGPDGGYVGSDLRELGTARRPVLVPVPVPANANGAPAEIIDPLEVTIQSPTPGAVVRYTIDGTMPTAEHGTVAAGPIAVKTTTTIQAVALLEGRAPSPPTAGTYLIRGSSRPGMCTFHWGNSLTQTTAMFAAYARTAGHAHQAAIFGRPGAWTKELWDIGLTQEKERAFTLWDSLPRVDHLTVQPRDFNIAEEADYDIKFFRMARRKTPEVQPWLYCEWTEMKRERPTDKGLVPSSQMKVTPPALTWEESMGAMLLYMEEVQREIGKTYNEGKPPRVLPTALAMGWIKNLIDAGKVPGVAPGSFYPLLFNDQVHPTSSPLNNAHGNGGYLVDLTWYAAFYRESPEARVLPVGTTFTLEQSAILQRLAWDVIKNYPDCGLYEPGETPVGRPETLGAPGPSSDVTSVTLSSSTPGAWFRYTLDGTSPTRTTGYVYCGVVSVRPGMILKAIAYKSGMADSPVAEATFPAGR